VLRGRKLLVPEENYKILQQCLMHLLELRITQRTRQIDTLNFRADRWRQLTHCNLSRYHRQILLAEKTIPHTF
jgi:hypothetical protein